MELRHLDSIVRAMGLPVRRDSSPSVFVENELKQIVPQLYNRLFPMLEALRVVPSGGLSVSPGATSFAFDGFDQRGQARWLGAGATDMPRADVSKSRETFPVRPFGIAYGWTVQEIMSAQFAGIPLNSLKGDAARRASAEFEDDVLLNGDSSMGVPGFLTEARVPLVAVPNGDWDNATADDIVEDVNFLIDRPWLGTKQVHRSDTLLLPPAKFRKIQTTRLPDTNITILQFIQGANPGLAIEILRALETAGPSGAPRALAYERSPSNVTSVIPLPYTQLEPQVAGFEVVIHTWQAIGGTVWTRPMAGCYGDGI